MLGQGLPAYPGKRKSVLEPPLAPQTMSLLPTHHPVGPGWWIFYVHVCMTCMCRLRMTPGRFAPLPVVSEQRSDVAQCPHQAAPTATTCHRAAGGGSEVTLVHSNIIIIHRFIQTNISVEIIRFLGDYTDDSVFVRRVCQDKTTHRAW